MKDHNTYEILLDSVCGCLFGGAFGDALGFPVEFMSYDKIRFEYGDDGITEFDLRSSEKALISDDTQMSMFTANGILYGYTNNYLNNISVQLSSYIFKAYEQWYDTQVNGFNQAETEQICWIYNIETLHNSRAPGSTCMAAIANSGGVGTPENPVNDSKGCGGVMRVAPIACFAACGNIYDEVQVALESANVAALTHGHPLGYIPAAFVGCLIYNLIKENQNIEELITESMNVVKSLYGSNSHFYLFESIIDKAVYLAKENIEDNIAVKQLGEGWVAEEATAIAIYSVLKYENDFMRAIVCAVNHDGDSDSTGSIAGNLLGAYLGLSTIDPEGNKVIQLEAYDVIFEMAQDLVEAYQVAKNESFNNVKWKAKYLTAIYGK